MDQLAYSSITVLIALFKLVLLGKNQTTQQWFGLAIISGGGLTADTKEMVNRLIHLHVISLVAHPDQPCLIYLHVISLVAHTVHVVLLQDCSGLQPHRASQSALPAGGILINMAEAWETATGDVVIGVIAAVAAASCYAVVYVVSEQTLARPFSKDPPPPVCLCVFDGILNSYVVGFYIVVHTGPRWGSLVTEHVTAKAGQYGPMTVVVLLLMAAAGLHNWSLFELQVTPETSRINMPAWASLLSPLSSLLSPLWVAPSSRHSYNAFLCLVLVLVLLVLLVVLLDLLDLLLVLLFGLGLVLLVLLLLVLLVLLVLVLVLVLRNNTLCVTLQHCAHCNTPNGSPPQEISGSVAAGVNKAGVPHRTPTGPHRTPTGPHRTPRTPHQHASLGVLCELVCRL